MKTRKGRQTSRRAANTVVTSTNARRYRKLVMSLAAVVVFVTTYALVLPALTLDEDKADSTPGIEVMTEQAAEEIAPEEKEKSSAQEQAVSEQPQESEQADSSNAGSSSEKPSASSGSDRKSNSENGTKVESADSDNELSLITERTELKFDGAGYKIICEAGADTKLPADVKLKVKEVKKAEDVSDSDIEESKVTGESGREYTFDDLEKKAGETVDIGENAQIKLLDISFR